MSGVEKTKAPLPVSCSENRDAGGKAVCAKSLFDRHMERVTDLRARQEAYEASLPKDPGEALSEVRRALKDTRDPYSDEYGARAALTIIQELAMKGGLDDSDQMNEAVYWLTIKGLDGLKLIEDGSRRAMDIVGQFRSGHRPFEA